MERDNQDIFLMPPYPRRPTPSTSLSWLRGHDDRDLFEPPIGESERLVIAVLATSLVWLILLAAAVGVAACVAGVRPEVRSEEAGR